jgi:hypothetical protein
MATVMLNVPVVGLLYFSDKEESRNVLLLAHP